MFENFVARVAKSLQSSRQLSIADEEVVGVESGDGEDADVLPGQRGHEGGQDTHFGQVERAMSF
jgi:hypothetical protein